jgi:hypothetical protein
LGSDNKKEGRMSAAKMPKKVALDISRATLQPNELGLNCINRHYDSFLLFGKGKGKSW